MSPNTSAGFRSVWLLTIHITNLATINRGSVRDEATVHRRHELLNLFSWNGELFAYAPEFCSAMLDSLRIAQFYLETVDNFDHRLHIHTVRFISKKRDGTFYVVTGLDFAGSHDLVISR
jgi:hypothetical protein